MDAQVLVIAVGVGVLGAAWAPRVEAEVSPRVLRVGDRWLEERQIEPAVPPWVVDGGVLTWAPPVVVCPTSDVRADHRVHLNSASTAALEDLPGVGPALARRIRDGRPYHRVEDLDRVRGIGPATVARLRPLVRP